MSRNDSLARRFEPQFRSAGIDVQVTPIFIDHEFVPEAALRRTLLIAHQLRDEIQSTDGMVLCTEGDRIEPAVADGNVVVILALEGSHGVGADVELFDILFGLGVRMASFTHMGNTLLAGGSADGEPGAGLSAPGIAAVAALERLGIVMDVSHLSVQSTDDVLQRATRPLVASHSSLKSVREHHRNITDEHAKGIASLGGVIGVPAAIPSFIDPENPTIARVVDHIEHIAETVGIDHVGIGADFMLEYIDEIYATYPDLEMYGEDVRAVIEGFESPASMPALAAELEGRGIAGDDLAKVLGGNFLRVFREVIGVAG